MYQDGAAGGGGDGGNVVRNYAPGAGRDFTLILEDPMASTAVFPPTHPDPPPSGPDGGPLLTVKAYKRSFEENEELGLNDMRTSGDYTSLDRDALEGGNE